MLCLLFRYHTIAPVTSVCLSGDGNCLLVGTLDSTVRLLDRDKGHLLSSYSGHQNVKYKLDSRLSNTDAHVLSGSEDGSIHIWELVQVGHFLFVCLFHFFLSFFFFISFFFFSFFFFLSFFLFLFFNFFLFPGNSPFFIPSHFFLGANFEQAKTVKVLKAHEKAVTALSYHPKESLMISGSIDGKIKIWKSP